MRFVGLDKGFMVVSKGCIKVSLSYGGYGPHGHRLLSFLRRTDVFQKERRIVLQLSTKWEAAYSRRETHPICSKVQKFRV